LIDNEREILIEKAIRMHYLIETCHIKYLASI